MLELQSYSKWEENANCPVTIRIYVEGSRVSCYKFVTRAGKRSSLEIVFQRTWRTGRTTARVRYEEAERRSVRSPGSVVSPWPTRRDTVNGTEAKRARARRQPCLACQVEYNEEGGSGDDDRRRREFSGSHHDGGDISGRADRSILCSSTTVSGPPNASECFLCRVDDR